jgi:biopolymer transport protein ExbD
VTGGGGSSTLNLCASYQRDGETIQGAFDGQDCTYNTSFVSASNVLNSDVTLRNLSNGGVHYFLGSLVMGESCDTDGGTCTIEPNGPTLTVNAGATVVFGETNSHVLINRGANIEADGTIDNPITFTSANAIPRLDTVGSGPQYQDWAGVLINGFGITDQCTDAQRDGNTCSAESEGVISFYGGTDNADDSGTLRFVKIHFAGGLPAGAEVGNDLNSLSLFAVGSGTTIDYIDIYQGYDDGIELFGGAVDLKHIVVTDTQDDSIDIDAGWQGNAQFILVKHGKVQNTNGEIVNMGNGGFEADGEKGRSSEQAPASAPNITNVTVITTDERSNRDDDESIAVKLDDDISATWYNTLLVKESALQTWCINYSADAAGVIIDNTVSFQNSVVACDQVAKAGAETVTLDTNSVELNDWFTGSSSEILGGNANVLAANGFSTLTTGSDITVTAFDPTTLNTADSSFFEAANYIGALSDTDTTSDWYRWASAAFINASAND